MTEDFRDISQDQYTTFSHSWFDPWKEKDISCDYRFRKPKQAEIRRFNKDVQKTASTAQTNLLITIIHPDDREKLQADMEEYPALALTCVGWALKASGLANDLGN